MAGMLEASFSHFDELFRQLKNVDTNRTIVAIAGPPGSGKSTFSKKLCDALNSGRAGFAAVVPMDGFHYDDYVLEEKGLKNRKGSPATFDVAGFEVLLKRLKANEEPEIAVSVFDRELELSRAAARIIPRTVRIILAEGNYLLLCEHPWVRLKTYFDRSIVIFEDRAVLEKRLLERWKSHGFSAVEAAAKVLNNDLPNVEIVYSLSVQADMVIRGC